jgi:sugar fermentation stimulation protein A
MEFPQPLVHGTLIRRYKRFLADVFLDDGTEVIAHCTNSGSMKSCLEAGAEVYLMPVNDPFRKTRFTWEMIKINQKWVGVNTSNPNLLAFEAIKNKEIPGLDVYDRFYREVKFDESRLDIFAENDQEKCAIEVKNVTMKEGDWALFPDARTERGLKHLNTLIRLKKSGMRAVMLFVIQRMDVDKFAPARLIDPNYAKGLLEAEKCGVEIFPMQAEVTPTGIRFVRKLDYKLDI